MGDLAQKFHHEHFAKQERNMTKQAVVVIVYQGMHAPPPPPPLEGDCKSRDYKGGSKGVVLEKGRSD